MNQNYDDPDIPAPPPHRYSQSIRNNASITPGVDNLGPSSVGGGISGIALGVANSHDRLSGVEAIRDYDRSPSPVNSYTGPAERGYNTAGSDNPYIPAHSASLSTSSMGFGAAGGSSAALNENRNSYGNQDYAYSGGNGSGGIVSDGPYARNSYYNTSPIINPDDIADDGDDFAPAPSQHPAHRGSAAAAGAGAGAGAGAASGGLFSGFFGTEKNADVSYGPVPGGGLEEAQASSRAPKTEMAARKKRGLLIGLALGFVVLAAIVGGAVGGILGSRAREGGASSDKSAASDESKNGDLDKNSDEIKALMGNDKLHKVFPGMDYTPWGVQYPLCEKYPPSQNNVTRDLAVLSQLTNTVRLYGTDCNQTEMTLHAIDKLELTDMKLWLGVWIDTNETTTKRQIKQLYTLLDDEKHTSIYKGVIVGNEALYRAGDTKAEAEKNLIGYIKDVRDEVKKRNLDLSIATSDLGDNWNQELADAVDLVMSNVHPFFAGVNVDDAAAWTWDFWQTHDVPLTKGTQKKNIISEVGWPSGGGKDCGGSSTCDADTPGSVASIDNMNKFMSDWICQALDNGTDYFWFEAFDEPWKVQFNTDKEKWEDKWGLMDQARKVKDGLKIPDCGGKTA